MPKSISWRKFIKRMKKLGFDGPYSGGRHLFMVKDGRRITIPNPHRGDIGQDLLFRILKQADINTKLWESVK